MRKITLISIGIAGAAALAASAYFSTGEKGEAKVLFVGDMMFDRTIRSIAEKSGYGHTFSCVSDYLRGFDLVVGNLEGPITEHPSRSKGTVPGDPGNTSFTFEPAIIKSLLDNRVKVLHLGNNHILDFGWEGAASTAEALDSSGISHFGIPGYSPAATATVDGVRIGFASFNQFLGQGDIEKTAVTVRALKAENDHVFVYAHWGDEYSDEGEYQKSAARRFIDAGATAVIGSHPHVIQGVEEYKGGRIYYSLGNFIFDQYWNEEVSTGMGVEVSISRNRVAYAETLFDIARGGATCLRSPVDTE